MTAQAKDEEAASCGEADRTDLAATLGAHINATSCFVRLLRSDKGTSVMELAIVAPVLVVLLVGISDLAHGFSQRFFLQQAVNRTMELGHLGPTAGTYDHLKAEAARAADVPESNVSLEQWLECDGTKKEFNGVCDTGQMPVRYVRLEISKAYQPMFGRMGYTAVAPDGTATIRSEFHLRVAT